MFYVLVRSLRGSARKRFLNAVHAHMRLHVDMMIINGDDGNMIVMVMMVVMSRGMRVVMVKQCKTRSTTTIETRKCMQ